MSIEQEQLAIDFDTPIEVRDAEGHLSPHAKRVWDRSAFSETELPYWVDLINLLVANGRFAARFLLHPENKEEPTKKQIRRVLTEIIHEYSQKLDETDALLKVLRKVVIRGRQTSVIIEDKPVPVWRLGPTPASSYVPREKNRFTPERFKLINRYKRWRSQLKQTLAINDLSPQEELGRILLSAVLNGGLISTHLMAGLHKALQQPDCIQLLNRQSYIRISASWLGHEDVEVRNWYPDPVTEALILRRTLTNEKDFDAKGQQSTATKYLFGNIKALLRRTGIKSKQQPRTMTELLDSTALYLELRIPPFVAQYLKRKHLSHSLRASSLYRLARRPTEGSQESTDLPGLDLSRWKKKAGRSQHFDNKNSAEVPWLTRLTDREVVKNPEHFINQLDTEIQHIAQQSRSSAEYLLLKWAHYLLVFGHEKKSSLSPTTIAGYLTSIGSRLVEYLDARPIKQLSASELEETYTQILDDIESRGHRIKVARALHHFQSYLEKEVYVEPIDTHGVLGIQSSPAPVDAQIIWVEEFKKLLDCLEISQLEKIHPDLVTITQILAILGYKCGLRRSEALKLRIVDLQGQAYPELLIRPHAKRRLKTSSSQRRLPLKLFLDADELKLLLDWKQKRFEHFKEQDNQLPDYRRKRCAKLPDGFLFGIAEKNYDFVPEELVFPAIHKALREATQDPTVRYHHFRHSFASLTLMRLMVADQGLPEGFFEMQPETQTWLEQGEAMKEALYPEQGPTRKHLHYVAAFLGHSSPNISLEHYIHLMDVISRHLIQKHLPPDIDMLIAASGVAQSTAYRWCQKGTQEFIENLRWKYRDLYPDLNPQAKQKNKIRKAETDAETLSDDRYSFYKELSRLRNLIFSHEVHGMSELELSKRSGFSSELLGKVFNKSKKLERLKSSSNSTEPLLKLLKRPRNSPQEAKSWIGIPAEISNDADQKMAKEMCALMYNYNLEHPDEFDSWLNLWLANTRKEKHWVIFKEQADKEDEAKAFIDTLLAMQIPKEWIRLTLLHGKKAEDRWIKTSLKHWKNMLPQARKLEWTTQSFHDGNKLDQHGRLAINLINKEIGKASEASRFLMMMWLLYKA